MTTGFLAYISSGSIWVLWEGGISIPILQLWQLRLIEAEISLTKVTQGVWADQGLLVPSLEVLSSTASSHLTWGKLLAFQAMLAWRASLGGEVGRGLLILLSLLLLSEADFAYLQNSPLFLDPSDRP